MKAFTVLTDQQLIALYQSGNPDALSTLVYRYKNPLYTSIYLLVKDKYLAEDFFQDTFIKIIDKLKGGKYTDEGKFLSWATRIAYNLCVDHFRKLKRLPPVKTSEDWDIFESINISEGSREVEIIKTENENQVNKMLDKLPQEQREVIILRHYANLSFKEIASLTNCSVNTALGRMRYALLNLRKMNACAELVS